MDTSVSAAYLKINGLTSEDKAMLYCMRDSVWQCTPSACPDRTPPQTKKWDNWIGLRTRQGDKPPDFLTQSVYWCCHRYIRNSWQVFKRADAMWSRGWEGSPERTCVVYCVLCRGHIGSILVLWMRDAHGGMVWETWLWSGFGIWTAVTPQQVLQHPLFLNNGGVWDKTKYMKVRDETLCPWLSPRIAEMIMWQ